MASAADLAPVAAAIAAATGREFRLERCITVGGGCIHRALRLDGCGQRYFVKVNDATAAAMFAAEADGLGALAVTGAVRVPRPIATGASGDISYLALEWFDLAPLDAASGADLGRALAAQHRHTGKQHGWQRDNFIGATPQANLPQRDAWPLFFADCRLRPQLRLAAQRGMEAGLVAGGEFVADRLAALFVDHHPAASLLHGDLWSGNAAALGDGEAVIFDPAVYCGDRETDLAMAELFGGFPEAFYGAYREAWPLDPGFEARKTLYNLYHVLNHFNLFGAGYLGQARRMIERLRSDLKG